MKIYTDGSYLGKKYSGKTGYGAIILSSTDDANSKPSHIIYGCLIDEYAHMHNVGGEIWAVVSGIEYAANVLHAKELEIYHDYIGISHWAAGVWKCKNPMTREYRNFIKKMRESVTITFHKVKAHSNNPLNDLADSYAKKGILDFSGSRNSFNLIIL